MTIARMIEHLELQAAQTAAAIAALKQLTVQMTGQKRRGRPAGSKNKPRIAAAETGTGTGKRKSRKTQGRKTRQPRKSA